MSAGWVGMNEQWPKAGEEVITRGVLIRRNGEVEVIEALRTFRLHEGYGTCHWDPFPTTPDGAIRAEVTHWHPYRNYTLLYRQGSEEKRVDRVKTISSPVEHPSFPGEPLLHSIQLWNGKAFYADELLGALDEQGNVLWVKEEEEPC